MASKLEYTVPFVAQQNTQTCWYACAQMITRYWKSRVALYGETTTVDTKSLTDSINKLNMPVMGNASMINQSVGPALGYRMWIPGPKISADQLFAKMNQNGPLWYAGNNNGFNGSVSGSHAVVLTGISVDGASSYVTIHDPWPPLEGQEDALYPYDEFMSKLSPVCLMFPDPNSVGAAFFVQSGISAWKYLAGAR